MGGMILTGENWSTGEKPAQVPLCPPQIPHGLPGLTLTLLMWRICWAPNNASRWDL